MCYETQCFVTWLVFCDMSKHSVLENFLELAFVWVEREKWQKWQQKAIFDIEKRDLFNSQYNFSSDISLLN